MSVVSVRRGPQLGSRTPAPRALTRSRSSAERQVLARQSPPHQDSRWMRYEMTAIVLESAGHGPEACPAVLASLPPQGRGVPLRNFSWDEITGEERVRNTIWAQLHVVGTWDGEALTLTEPPTPATASSRAYEPALEPLCPPRIVDESRVGWMDWRAAIEVANALPDVAALWVKDPDAGGPRGWVPEAAAINVVVVRHAARAEAAIRRSWGGWLCVVERDQPTLARLKDVQHQLTTAEVRDAIGQTWSVAVDQRRGVVVLVTTIADGQAQESVDERFGVGIVAIRGLLQPIG
jgi:hypothetical protein